MKKHFFLLNTILIISYIYLLFSCTEKSILEDYTLESTVLTDVQLLAKLGLDTTDIREYEYYYVVEKDQAWGKDLLEQIRNEPQTRMQYNKNNNFLDAEHQTVYIDNRQINDLGRISRALTKAIKAWNDIEGSNIKFVYGHPTNNCVVATISEHNDTDGLALMEISRPYNGKYGRYFNINVRSSNFPLADENQLCYMYMHALGHIVGFEHALIKASPDAPNHIEGTILVDRNSIMLDELNLNFGYKWNGFSKADTAAILKVYPKKEWLFTVSPQAIGSQKNILQLGTYYTFTVKYKDPSCPNPLYDMYIDEQAYGLDGFKADRLENGKIGYQFEYGGAYIVYASVKNSVPFTELWTYFNIYDDRIHIKGPKKVELGKFYDFETLCFTEKSVSHTYNIFTDELVFDNIATTEQRINNSTLRVRFNQPGAYYVIATAKNEPEIKTGQYDVEIYYRPYFKIERTLNSSTGYLIPAGSESFSNIVRFYVDEACTIPLKKTPYRLRFKLILKNKITSFNGFWKYETEEIVSTTTIQKPEGISYINLPTVQNILVQELPGYTLSEPYYEIEYYKDKIGEWKPQ